MQESFRSQVIKMLKINSPHHPEERLAESARYALLRRLAPMLRHNMAGALQPLSMMSAILEKRLQSAGPDFVALARNSSQLHTLAREAANDCMSLMSWLAPAVSDLVTVASGVEDATGLVLTELSFKGFNIINRTGDMQAEVPRSLTRNVFMAALMTLTDATSGPANVVLNAQLMGNEIELTICIEPVQGEWLTTGVPPYRNLEWADVQALAELEHVTLTHTAGNVKLHFPLSATKV